MVIRAPEVGIAPPMMNLVDRPMASGVPSTAAAELTLLKSLVPAIAGAEDHYEALSLALEKIGELAGWTAGESWLPDPRGELLCRGPVWSRDGARLQEFHAASERFAFRPGEGIPGRAWRDGSVIWVDDVTLEPHFVRRELASRSGLRTAFAIPVFADFQVVAVLVFYHSEVRPQDPGLVELVVAVAASLGALIRRQRAEDELQRYVRELARSNAELEQFAYVASHDLQEPLRMVASYTQLLARRYGDRLDDDAKEFIGFAVEGVNRMQQLILDLLAVSRVSTQAEPSEPVDLDRVLNDVLAEFRMMGDTEHAIISRDPLPRMVVDGGLVHQLFQQLIGNALKFRGPEPVRIHISAMRTEAEWIFACRDNGIGIHPDHFERIFAIFQRLHPRGTYSGNGIGLALCRKIVERHGGRMWIASAPSAGSTFYFTLPTQREAGATG